MPLYEYACVEHGTFELIKSIADSREPAFCPECSASATRVLSAPHLSSVPRSQMIARDRNERSRHEPRVSSSPGGCSHSGRCNHVRPKPGQLKAYQGKRPWVIEHG